MPQLLDIIGIGNAIVDIIAPMPEEFLAAQGVSKGSMTLIDQDKAEAIYAAMGPTTVVSGGSAANTIVGAASFGATCAFIGRVKDDLLGEMFADGLRLLGVQYDTTRAGDGPATARSFIFVTPDGERTMNTYLGASQHLTETDITADAIAGAKLTYLEGYLWDPPAAKAAFRKAATLAHAAGREVVLTLSDSFCVHRYRDEFRHLLTSGMVDLVFANEHELCALYEAEFEPALAALRLDAKRAVVTRSEKGALAIEGAQTTPIPPVPITKLVDATGAGDAFAAGYLYGYTRALPAARCGQLGALAASHIIQKIGARADIPFNDLARKAGLL